MRYGYKEYKDLDLCDIYHKIKMMAEDLDQSLKIHKLRKEVRELIENENKKKDTNKDKKAKSKRVTKNKDTNKDKKAKSKRVNKKKDTDIQKYRRKISILYQ